MSPELLLSLLAILPILSVGVHPVCKVGVVLRCFDGAAVGCAAAARLAVILADLFLNIFSGNCVASVQVAYEL